MRVEGARLLGQVARCEQPLCYGVFQGAAQFPGTLVDTWMTRFAAHMDGALPVDRAGWRRVVAARGGGRGSRGAGRSDSGGGCGPWEFYASQVSPPERVPP